MNPIDTNIQEPDAETFNPYALNPTVEVYVGNCGPLETWNETKHVCVPKDGVESSAENNDDNDDNDGSNSDALIRLVKMRNLRIRAMMAR